MAAEQRLIDATELDGKLEALANKYAEQGRYESAKDYSFVQTVLLAAPTVDAVALPCRIGDIVWAIRCYRGVLVPQQGKVSEMLFTDDMMLSIVVKHICRGEWGKTVFATKEDAERAIKERSKLYA